MTKSAYNSCVLYRNELVSNSTQTSIRIVNCLFLGYNLGYLNNFLIASLFICDSRACATKPGLVIKKEKLLKTFKYLISYIL